MKTLATFATLFNVVFLFSTTEICAKIIDDTGEVPILRFNDENGKFLPRIVGGRLTKLGEYRGIVSIQVVTTTGNSHLCGGTLWNSTAVVTAAHCVQSKGKLYNRKIFEIVGDDTSVGEAGPKRQVRKVARIFSHPRFDGNTIANDVAVIFVFPPFVTTDTFGPVPLPESDVHANQTCGIAGWGTTEYHDPATEDDEEIDLRSVDVSIILRDDCNGPNSYRGNVPENAICAGSMEGGRDSCQGDSGGGLICNGELTGIVSFGNECARPHFPGIYTNVYRYRDWIQNLNGASSMLISIRMMATIFIFYSVRLFY